jgi:NADH-quinone oxidoreductase subunit L
VVAKLAGARRSHRAFVVLAEHGDFKVEIGLQLDRLSLLMLLVVTGVGEPYPLYSYGYMNGDRGFARFFASLSLFMFSMLGIVLAIISS